MVNYINVREIIKKLTYANELLQTVTNFMIDINAKVEETSSMYCSGNRTRVNDIAMFQRITFQRGKTSNSGWVARLST